MQRLATHHSTPTLTLPRRKSGLPDLRINVRNSGKPELRRGRGLLACVAVVSFSTVTLIGALTALAQRPPSVSNDSPRDRMLQVHQTLITAESGLGKSVRDRDYKQAYVMASLFQMLGSLVREQEFPKGACQEAVGELQGAAIAVAYALSPASTRERLSKQAEQLPSARTTPLTDATLDKWYDGHSRNYRAKIAICEKDIGIQPTTRSLADQVPRN